MKPSFYIIAFLLMAAGGLNAQSTDQSEREQQDREQAEERDRTVKGRRTDNELKDDRGQVPETNAEDLQNSDHQSNNNSDESTNEADSANAVAGGANEVVQRNEDQPQNEQSRYLAPAVIQRTTSASGSPAVLAPENGDGLDGTNTVQRAKPNMAGAQEPGNLNLSEHNVEGSNYDAGRQVQDTEDIPAVIGSPEQQQRASEMEGKKLENGTLKDAESPEEKARENANIETDSTQHRSSAKSPSPEKNGES